VQLVVLVLARHELYDAHQIDAFFDSCAYRPEMSVLHGLVKLLFASLLLCASKFVESGDLYRMRMEKGVNIVTFCTYSAISYILK